MTGLPTDPGAIVVGLLLDDPTPGHDCGIPGCPGSLEDQARACDLCHGTGWAAFADPFVDGDVIDAVCPCGAGDKAGLVGASPGAARPGVEKAGSARPGKARHAMAWRGSAGRGVARQARPGPS